MSGYRSFAICMQWVRRKDTLRPEEKQFGPWLRATLGKVQKPQTITAMTNGEFSRGKVTMRYRWNDEAKGTSRGGWCHSLVKSFQD